MNTLRQFYCALGLFYSQTLLAAESEQVVSASKSLPQSPLTADALLQTFLGLGAILAIIVALAWLIKRTGRFQSSPNGEIKIIAGIPLGTRERAVLLEVSGERVLVGVTTQQIQTLHILGQNGDSATSPSFNQHLDDVLKKQS